MGKQRGESECRVGLREWLESERGESGVERVEKKERVFPRRS